MRRRRWFRFGFLFGYVLGTKAGRERYEDLRRGLLRLRATEPFRTAEIKMREQLRSVRKAAVTSTNGSYPATSYEAEALGLRGPGVQP
jgi:hypothetical protein